MMIMTYGLLLSVAVCCCLFPICGSVSEIVFRSTKIKREVRTTRDQRIAIKLSDAAEDVVELELFEVRVTAVRANYDDNDL